MKILSLLDEITHVYQIIIASGSAPSLRQWFRTLLEASIFSMYANTVINIHVGTDGDINVDTDALLKRVSTTSAPIATVLIALASAIATATDHDNHHLLSTQNRYNYDLGKDRILEILHPPPFPYNTVATCICRILHAYHICLASFFADEPM